jgi:hypothetical protein
VDGCGMVENQAIGAGGVCSEALSARSAQS